MYHKKCENCGGLMHSASRKNFICPYCGYDNGDIEIPSKEGRDEDKD